MALVQTLPGMELLYDHAISSRLITCFDVAAVTMFLYDYFLTLGMEVDLVWSSSLGPMKILFAIQRYLPFLDTAVLCLLQLLSTTISPSVCRLAGNIQSYLMVTGFLLSELIFTLRAWAVWKRDKLLGIALSIFLLAIAVASYVVVCLSQRSLAYSGRPYPGFQGCYMTGSNKVSYVNWLLLMAYEAVLLVLMIIPGVTAYREGGNKGLYAVVYCDGILFYVYLFVLSTTNVIVINAFPADYFYILSPAERCLHSVLASRVLLHIRDYVSMRNEEAIFLPHDGIADIQLLLPVLQGRMIQ